MMGVRRRRYVPIGVPGGWRIKDNKTNRWWGDLYEMQPDALVNELNTKKRPTRVTALLTTTRKIKR